MSRQNIKPGQRIIHADRCSSMSSKILALLLADLGVPKTHSRPHVSNDNPYSESQFKTMKYRPEFPERFGCLQDARESCREFFHWYNCEHYHSGLGYLTPFAVHFGKAQQQREQRAAVLRRAYERNPGRFVRGLPQPAALPEQVWINRPNEVDIKSIRAVNSHESIGGSQNGFHNGVIKNERESGRAPGRGQNQVSEDLAH